MSYFFRQKISTISTPLNIRGIGTSKHKSAQFAALPFYFPGKNWAGQQVYALIKCELHLVNGFQANILVGNNILFSKDFAININKNRALIGSCRVTISINAKQRKQFFRRKLLASNNNMVLPCSETIIPLALISLSDDCDFLFYPTA